MIQNCSLQLREFRARASAVEYSPSEKFYEQLSKVTPRQKKAGQKVDSIHLVEPARKKKVNASAEKITNFLTKAGSDISDSFRVVSKVTGNLANATAKSKLVKNIRSGIKKKVKRTSKLFKK